MKNATIKCRHCGWTGPAKIPDRMSEQTGRPIIPIPSGFEWGNRCPKCGNPFNLDDPGSEKSGFQIIR